MSDDWLENSILRKTIFARGERKVGDERLEKKNEITRSSNPSRELIAGKR
jgi:hypothetical protein